MPPVFEQPGGRGGSSSDQRNYAQLASILQQRYAADADRQQRGMLGFAELAERQSANQADYNLAIARLQLQPILQEQQARLEIDNWAMKQQFNQQDQAELNRQNAVISELMDKRDKGDISDAEFYAQARQIAPRVNVLQAKEAHTKNAALAEQRKQHAALFEEQIRMRDRAAAYQAQELEGKLDLYVPPRYAAQLSEMMADSYPELKSGTPAYDAQLKALADEMGWAMLYAKDKGGQPIFQKDVYGQAQGGEGSTSGKGGAEKPITEHDVAANALKARQAAEAWAAKQETPPSQEQIDAKEATYQQAIDKALTAHRATTKEGKREAAMKTHEAALTSLNGAKDLFETAPTFDPRMKAVAKQTVEDARRLMEKYPPGKRPAAIAKKIDALVDRIEQFKFNAESKAPSRAQPPAAAQPEPQRPSLLDRIGSALSSYNPSAGGGGGY